MHHHRAGYPVKNDDPFDPDGISQQQAIHKIDDQVCVFRGVIYGDGQIGAVSPDNVFSTPHQPYFPSLDISFYEINPGYGLQSTEFVDRQHLHLIYDVVLQGAPGWSADLAERGI